MNNEDIKDKEDFTPYATTVRCSFFPFTYNVSSNVDLVTITAAHVLAKVNKADNSFEPGKFDLGFYPEETKTLIIFKPSVLLSKYGFTNPTTMTLSIGRKPRPCSKLKSQHR